MDRHPDFPGRHLAGHLALHRRVGRTPSGPARQRHPVAGAGDRHCPGTLGCSPCRPITGGRRHLRRRRHRGQFRAHHHHLVLFPVSPGRQRLHGPRGFRQRQTVASPRPDGPQHRTTAHRLRLLGAGRHVDPHPAVGPRPPAHHPADTFHELLRQDPHLCFLHCGIFPGTRRPGTGHPLPVGHPGRHPRGPSVEKDPSRPRTLAFRHGVAQLPDAGRQECGHAALGQDQRLPAKGLHGDFRRIHRHLVPPVV